MQVPTDVVGEALGLYAGRLRGFVAARVPRDDVDDVLQTAALRAVERSTALRDPERVLPWLYRIHRNTITDLWRRRAGKEPPKPLEEAPPLSVDAVDPADDPCDCSVVQARRIHPSYAAVLGLVDAGDATLAEAAASLGISVNNATVRLHRARKALRKQMQQHCGVSDPRDCLDCRCVEDGCCATDAA